MSRGAYLEVLLVDDDPLDVMLFTTAVRKSTFNIHLHTASSAQQAMDYLQGKGPCEDRSLHPMPDVMVLDLIMPGMTGADLLAWRRGSGKFLKLPIVVLSGAADEEQTRQALALGARAYLAKPAAFEGWKDVLQVVWNTGLAHKLAGGSTLQSRPLKGRKLGTLRLSRERGPKQALPRERARQ